ncbi:MULTISPECIES: hypothetical protein [unclassified Sphingomonas]|uniref:hypothetical protein n=1 Tax=unclassified Sphingomonas TaxID=196159 RepID=UPI000836963D|nr:MULTISPECIES: hypothetical protein [unclassified Sphingomonas]
MRHLLILISAVALAGCSEAASEPPPVVATDEMPAEIGFELRLDGARSLIANLGAAYRDPIDISVHDDGFSGGQMVHLLFRDRSASIGVLPDGRVWQLAVRAGIGDRCGKSQEIQQAVVPMLLAVRLMPTSPQLADLTRGLSSETPVKTFFGRKRATTVGGCIKTLDIRTDV